MKEVMAKQSSVQTQGVPSFEYNAASERQPMLFSFLPRPIDDLKDDLLRQFAGETLTMRAIYERHSVNTPYLARNYKEALRKLEAEHSITAEPPSDKRRKIKGEVSFADDVLVTFT